MKELPTKSPLDQITYEDLYRRWEKGNWSATEIDFSEDKEQWHGTFSEIERKAALWNYSLFFHGEDSVADTASNEPQGGPDPLASGGTCGVQRGCVPTNAKGVQQKEQSGVHLIADEHPQRARELALGAPCPVADRGKDGRRGLDRGSALANQSGQPGAVAARHARRPLALRTAILAGSCGCEAIGSLLRLGEGGGARGIAQKKKGVRHSRTPLFSGQPGRIVDPL